MNQQENSLPTRLEILAEAEAKRCYLSGCFDDDLYETVEVARAAFVAGAKYIEQLVIQHLASGDF